METSVLIDELLLALLACRGPMISEDNKISAKYLPLLGYHLLHDPPSHLTLSSESQAQLISRDVLPCIVAFSSISAAHRASADVRNSHSAYISAMLQCVLSSCIQPYTQLITEIEAERLASISFPLISLKCRLDHWPLTHAYIDELIQDVLDQHLDGALLVHHLDELLNRCPASTPLHGILCALTSSVTAVFCIHLSRWLIKGELPAAASADASAFFIDAQDGAHVVLSRCPASLRFHMLQNILFIGLHASSGVSQPFKEELLKVGQLELLPPLISRMALAISTELIKRLDMINYLELIRLSFGMGAGWLFEGKIDVPLCNQRLNELCPHRKDAHPFQVSLRVVDKTVSIGWSTGSASNPLHHIFTPALLEKLNNVFSMLLDIKQISGLLNGQWKENKSSPHHSQMTFCINNIQRYCFLDIVHSKFRKLDRILKEQNGKLQFNDLQQLVESLVNDCFKGVFLANEAQSKLIHNIINSCEVGDYKMFSRYNALLSDITGL